jgi:YVTN family beta-propeller protein
MIASGRAAQPTSPPRIGSEGEEDHDDADCGSGREARLLAPNLVAGSCARRVLGLGGAAQAQPFVYVTGESGAVSQFDAIGGSLVALTPPLVESSPPESTPAGVVVSPDDESVYVANQFDDSVSQCNVRDDGTLSSKAPAKVTADKHPVSVVVSSDGRSVYTANFATSRV